MGCQCHINYGSDFLDKWLCLSILRSYLVDSLGHFGELIRRNLLLLLLLELLVVEEGRGGEGRVVELGVLVLVA